MAPADARRGVVPGAVLALVLACAGCGDGMRRHEAHGVVRDVDPGLGQVVIEHEDIPGLMPAMTMNFDVEDPALLERLEAGQTIHFEVVFDGDAYRVTDAEVLEAGQAGSGGVLSRLAAQRDPAPEFALVDQAGEPLRLQDLRGQAVVLDFIFTRCTGPCPVLTGIQVDLQRALPPALRERTRFVSITLDPEHDGPEELAAYARARGADLQDWSFLTGEPGMVDEVVRAYGVGVVKRPGMELQHLVVTFVLDPEGRIAERLVGLDPSLEERVAAVRAALRGSGQTVDQQGGDAEEGEEAEAVGEGGDDHA